VNWKKKQDTSPTPSLSRRLSSSATLVSTTPTHVKRSKTIHDIGMTNANMKLVTISVTLEDELLTPKPSLEVGEHIVTKVIALSELHQKLLEYDQKVCLHDVYMWKPAIDCV
jgi:hypothetical protein